MLGVVLQLFSRQGVGWIGGFAGYVYYFESQCLDGIRFCELVEGSHVEFDSAGNPNPLDSEAFRMAVRVRLAGGPQWRRLEGGTGESPGHRLPFPPTRTTAPMNTEPSSPEPIQGNASRYVRNWPLPPP
jgi:hypothetical protein